jgi:isocitrate dehydrogenase (NAD+)
VRVEGRHYPSVNNALRRELGAYANLRPVRGYAGVSGAYDGLDLVIVREVTEDLYLGLERQVDADTAEAVKRITRPASRRIARFACDYAVRHGRRTVTAVHKANVLHRTDGLFLESVRAVAADYPGLRFDDRMVDAACYHLVKVPGQFDVLVLPNQYGDILSDLAAGLVGSLGLAPGGNFGPDVAVFEAAHGAAPDIAGRGIANPLGLILSGALLLDHLGESAAAARVRRGVELVLAEGRWLTPDLGGRATTAELTRAVCDRLADLEDGG